MKWVWLLLLGCVESSRQRHFKQEYTVGLHGESFLSKQGLLFHVDRQHPIGQGAYGVVYKAHLVTHPNTTIVLKETLVGVHDQPVIPIPPRMIKYPFSRILSHPVKREALVLKRLGLLACEPILCSSVRVCDCYTPDTQRALIPILYKPGMSLEVHLQQSLPFEQVHQLYIGATRAIRELHQQGVVHGDLNLDNILYHQHNYSIIDYGQSRLFIQDTFCHAIRGCCSFLKHIFVFSYDFKEACRYDLEFFKDAFLFSLYKYGYTKAWMERIDALDIPVVSNQPKLWMSMESLVEYMDWQE